MFLYIYIRCVQDDLHVWRFIGNMKVKKHFVQNCFKYDLFNREEVSHEYYHR